MARIKQRTASANTQLRLAKVLQQVGTDAQQPKPMIMAQPWATVIDAAPRVAVLNGLRSVTAGAPGFDYGPVGLDLLRWITINKYALLIDPLSVWNAAQQSKGAPAVIAPPPRQPRLPRSVPPKAAPTLPHPGFPPSSIPVQPVSPPPGATGVTGDDAVPVIAVPEAGTPVPVIVPPDVIAPGKPLPAELAHPEWNWQPAAVVFDVPGLRGNVAVWPMQGTEGAHPRAYKLDKGYRWPVDHLQWAIFAAGQCPAKGIWNWGQRGSGKTEFARQFSARTGRPYFGITFTQTMEPSEFIGDKGAKNGNTEFEAGAMILALEEPIPAVILLDEITLGQSGHITGPLNEIVHPACSYCIPSNGRRIDFSDGHFFIAADNTNGTGDPTGLHHGTQPINRATSDRFSYFNRFTYLPKDDEIAMLMDRTGCDLSLAGRTWTILDALRKKVDTGLLSDPPSSREALAFCSAVTWGFDEKDSFEKAFVAKYAEESQEEMRVTFVACFKAEGDAATVTP